MHLLCQHQWRVHFWPTFHSLIRPVWKCPWPLLISLWSVFTLLGWAIFSVLNSRRNGLLPRSLFNLKNRYIYVVLRQRCSDRWNRGVINDYPLIYCLLLYPDWCPGVCWNWPIESLIQRFRVYVIRRLSGCTRVPHREGNSMRGPPLFNFGIR